MQSGRHCPHAVDPFSTQQHIEVCFGWNYHEHGCPAYASHHQIDFDSTKGISSRSFIISENHVVGFQIRVKESNLFSE